MLECGTVAGALVLMMERSVPGFEPASEKMVEKETKAKKIMMTDERKEESDKFSYFLSLSVFFFFSSSKFQFSSSLFN